LRPLTLAVSASVREHFGVSGHRHLIALVLAPLLTACTAAPAAVTTPTPSATIASTSAAKPSQSAAATATPQPSAALGENPTLGYRITLPGTYRLSRSLIVTGQPETLGSDTYTFTTQAQERAECEQDRGDIGSPSDGAYLIVAVYHDLTGASPVDWARSRPQNSHSTADATTINGLPAAKLLQRGETMAYVVAANDRMYEISPTMWPSQHPLDAIAGSFRALAPGPFPTPPPAPAVSARDAAAEMARSLAAAFSAKDADAVARLITPNCWLGFGATVGGMNTGGAVNRAVANFIPALRQRFAAGDLTVTVDPALQVDPRVGSAYVLRSRWIESDRTTSIDLHLGEFDGSWRWFGAMHYYDGYAANSCIPYRSPWITPTPGVCSP
jgi:hypothetical protein